MDIVLDVSPPTLHGLNLNGMPSFPPIQKRWASDLGRSSAYKSAAFQGLDSCGD